LVSKRPRIGHPDKSIPLAYLAKRGDIAFLKGWDQAVIQQACNFRTLPARYLNSEEDWLPGNLYPSDSSD
jgi:hypothetical protein